MPCSRRFCRSCRRMLLRCGWAAREVILQGLDSRRLTALVALVGAGFSVWRTLGSGQDLNFDLITYYFYSGFSAFSDRVGLDYLAAGAAGYQSPLPYALLYF